MLRDLRQLCEHSQDLDADGFRGAARALLGRQFLYLSRPRDRDPYRIVVNHYDYFCNLFDALGWTLHRDDDFGFIGLLPRETESFARLRLVDTLLLLCLRLLYEEGMDRYEVQEGSVFVEAEALLGRYETLLRRERPRISDFREILRGFVRHGVIETGETGADELPRIRILPSIRVLTDQQSVDRLSAYLPEDAEEAPATDDDADADGNEEPT